MKTFSLIAILFLLQGSVLRERTFFAADDAVCLSSEEKDLYDRMMEYRRAEGLPPIALSAKLTRVAQAHARDLAENYEFDPSNRCNPHSWSKKGNWSACCYTSDHRQAKCMWDKPGEIAGYESPGYEIAYYSSAGANAAEGLEGWKKSPAHNPLIVNSGIWEKVVWRAVGIGFYKQYGVVWFGELADATEPAPCATP